MRIKDRCASVSAEYWDMIMRYVMASQLAGLHFVAVISSWLCIIEMFDLLQCSGSRLVIRPPRVLVCLSD